MLGIIILIAAIVLMAKMAIMADRSPLLWGLNTFVLCIVASALITTPLVNLVVGLGASYACFAVRCITAK